MSGEDQDDTSRKLARATWLLGLIAKRLDPRPDGSATVDLPAPLAEVLREFIADEAPRP
jgi:hypothetical protein